MPRQPRQFGNSGYMHLIVRGIGKQILFENQDDYSFFLAILRRFSTETSVSILAYCLMENHVHLLVHDEQHHSPLLMKKIGVSYSRYFNRKYKRSGHLLQDRYRSEPIETDGSLIRVFRYILNNPEGAGLCPASSYPWSSYSQYGKANTLADTHLLRELIGDENQYAAFLSAKNQDRFMEYDDSPRSDEWAKDIIRSYLSAESGTILQSYDRARRDNALRALKKKGLSIRQLERLTGINRGAIQKAVNSSH